MCNFDDLANYVLVNVTVEGRISRKLLPKQQLRRPLSGKRLRQRLLRRGHFVTRTCSVPAECWPTMEPAARLRFRQRLELDKRLHVVNIIGPRIYYVQQTSVDWLTEEDTVRLMAQTMSSLTRQHQLINKEPLAVENEAARGSKRKLQLDIEEEPLYLPPELLLEILRSLNTLSQQRCRRTCSLFDEILTLPEMRKEVCISLDDSDAILEWNYAAYNCIFKLITPVTRAICIRDRRMGEHSYVSSEIQTYAGKAARYIKMVLDDAGIHIDRLIIFRSSITVKMYDTKFSNYLDSIRDVYSDVVSCCERLVWKGAIWRHFSYHRPPVVQFRIPCASCSLQSFDVATLWDLFEQHVCSDKALEVEQIAQLTRNLIAGKSDADCRKLIQNLCEYQIKDPRIPGRDWIPAWTTDDEGSLSVEHLASLDVKKLNKICLSAWWTLYIETDFWGRSPLTLLACGLH
ncbi:uncharacterized protein LOC129592545 [Paramacrobiotus metropolitanus]|uniref:uncharacterized protein LOC129592545 n=1 Tax=Paramacrobiotus metropolitanus TaxID=2943436 RepID=UPI0024459A4F|nr:uncharacterized protein LOC129592545 [Paramacrobiotus metropolitanus]